MPTLRTSERVVHMSPRFLLLARCETCRFFVTWVHQGTDGARLFATCCGFIFKAEAIDEGKTQFAVTNSEVGGSNVITFPPHLRPR